MAATVNVNGRVSDQEHAVISVFDHGFLYGEGVYETLRTYNGQPFLFDRHMRRLRNSAGMLALAVPLDRRRDRRALPRDDATRPASATTDARGVHPDAGHARRRRADLRPRRHARRPRSSSSSSRTSTRRREVFERGVEVVARRRSSATIPGTVNPLIKSNNLLNNALAMQEALRRGGFEGVMRNYRGELAECTQSNLFIVKDGAALTPPIDAGLLPGITREFLFEVGRDGRHRGPRSGAARRRSVRRRRGVPHQHHARGRADRAASTIARSARARRAGHARAARGLPPRRTRAHGEADDRLLRYCLASSRVTAPAAIRASFTAAVIAVFRPTPPAVMTPSATDVTLAINGGSSGVKCALFTFEARPQPVARGAIQGVGAASVPRLMDWVDAHVDGVTLTAVGHRIVHGGPMHHDPQRITTALLADFRDLVPFAPNHLPDEIALIEAMQRAAAGRISDRVLRYGLPPRDAGRRPATADSRRIRRPRHPALRLSSVVVRILLEACRGVARPNRRTVVILAHLGNGSSLAAVRAGRSIDTTMAFTPIGGVVMSTRSGDLDPGVVTYLARADD